MTAPTEPGWWRVLDAIIWVSVGLIAIISIEYFAGEIIRRRVRSVVRPEPVAETEPS